MARKRKTKTKSIIINQLWYSSTSEKGWSHEELGESWWIKSCWLNEKFTKTYSVALETNQNFFNTDLEKLGQGSRNVSPKIISGVVFRSIGFSSLWAWLKFARKKIFKTFHMAYNNRVIIFILLYGEVISSKLTKNNSKGITHISNKVCLITFCLPFEMFKTRDCLMSLWRRFILNIFWAKKSGHILKNKKWDTEFHLNLKPFPWTLYIFGKSCF